MKTLKPIKELRLTEHQIQDQILYFLSARRIFHWRNNTGAVKAEYNGKQRFVRFGVPGASDIIGILKDGRFLAIEVKAKLEYQFLMRNYDRLKAGQCNTKRDKHFYEQITFIENIKKNGGMAFFAWSVDQVLDRLKGV